MTSLLHFALSLAAWAAAPQPVHVYCIEDFESPTSLDEWVFNCDAVAALDSEHAAHSGHAARILYPKWKEGKGLWPAAIINYGKGGFKLKDWSRYDRLVFDVYNASAERAALKLRLDAAGKRYVRIFYVPPRKPFRCEVPIGDMTIDPRQVTHFDLYMTKPAVDFTIYLDHIRLEARPLTIEAASLTPDPFLSGRVRVSGELSRAGVWEVRVLDAKGRVAASHRQTDRRVEWLWDGQIAGAAAAPGRYSVVLKAFDPVWAKGRCVATRRVGEFRIASESQRSNLVAWIEPTTHKVMLHSRPAPGQPVATEKDLRAASTRVAARVDMCRNEYEGVQVVWLSRRRCKLRFAIRNLRHAQSGETFPMSRCAIYQVGYVKTKDPKTYKVDFVGWWPDPLLPAKEMTAEPGECMPIWISLKSEPDTRPGLYRGRLEVWADGRPAGYLPLEARVFGPALPNTTTVRTTFSTYNHMIARIYGGKLTKKMWRKYQEFIADHRINPDSIYRRSPPPIEDVIYFARRGQLNAFNLMYLPKANKKHPYDAARLKRIAAVLDPYVAKLREAGLADKAYIYGFDEVNRDQYAAMRRAFGFIKKRYPEIPTVTTGRDNTYGLESGLDDVVDIWVPLTARYDLERAEAARARGREVWWYICCGPRHPYANWFVEYSALEPRLLWWMTYQQKVPGFLYYTMSRWPLQKEPIRIDGRNKTNWNPASFRTYNGDGSLFCAGPDGPITTVRFENIRDGIEDYELLTLLAKRLGDGGKAARALCDELIPSLTTFTRDVEKFHEVRLRLLQRLEAAEKK